MNKILTITHKLVLAPSNYHFITLQENNDIMLHRVNSRPIISIEPKCRQSQLIFGIFSDIFHRIHLIRPHMVREIRDHF